MVSFLRRRAMHKGVLGGSRPWLIGWAADLAARLLRRLTHDEPEVVYSEELAPGETLTITSTDREPRIIGA